MQIKKIKFHPSPVVIFCFCIFILTACNPIVYLTENESLLTENKIQIIDRNSDESRSALKSELALNYKQIPNKEFLFIPREWYYFRFESAPPNSSFANWIKNVASEEPSIYDQDKIDGTVESMQNYLRYKKGYYNATVEATTKIKDQEAFVKYKVNTNKQYKIRYLEYSCEDSTLIQLIDDIKVNTLVPPGSGVEEVKFNEEKSRIVRILRQRGYARFNSNYIKFYGDTTINEPYSMDVFFNILAPEEGESHKRYTIGEINIYTDHFLGSDTSIKTRREFKSIDFLSSKDDFFVSPETLRKRVFIQEGSLYDRSKEIRTSQSINKLNTYRFVNLNPSIDENIDTIINYNFLLTPRNKLVEERSISAYLANVQSDENSFFLGLNGNYNLSSRNLLGNAENFSIGLDGYVEFNLNTVYSGGLTLENRLRLPKLNDFTRIIWLGNRLKFIPEKTYISLNDYSTTDLSASIAYSYTASIYGLVSANVDFGYNYKPNINKSTSFKPIGVNLLVLNPLENFISILENNPYLKNSFNNRLLTGFFFKDLNYSYNSNVNKSGFKWGFNYFFETSGLEVSVLNGAYNLLSNTDKVWQINVGNEENVEYSKYFKIDLDHYFNQRLGNGHSIAGRFRVGIANPFASSIAVPYVRQFAVGGQKSIRGWQIRELGPGGYDIDNDPNAPNNNTLPYQTGDFVLESSLEYRFPLFSYIRGATFIDAGNVWVLSDEDEREDSQLTDQFYKQIAIASGVGVRLDFSYFLLRFDFGYKIRNPFPNENGSYLNYQEFKLKNIADANLSLGVNLPF